MLVYKETGTSRQREFVRTIGRDIFVWCVGAGKADG